MILNLKQRYSDQGLQYPEGFANSQLNFIGYFNMDILEIRRKNARNLFGHNKPYKNLSSFANHIGRAPTYVSRIVGRKPTKGIGHNLARHIEQVCGLKIGSLDQKTHDNNLVADLGQEKAALEFEKFMNNSNWLSWSKHYYRDTYKVSIGSYKNYIVHLISATNPPLTDAIELISADFVVLAYEDQNGKVKFSGVSWLIAK